MSSRIQSFVNTRARFQRLEDAKLFSGWITGLTAKSAVVTVTQPSDLRPGQHFLFHVFGPELTAVFEARFEVQSGNLLAFGLQSPIKTRAGSEDMRLRIHGTRARLYSAPLPQDEFEEMSLGKSGESDPGIELGAAQVVDVSSRGVGIVGPIKFVKGDRLRVVLETPWGDTECLAEVKYSKSEGKNYRVGLAITEIDRLNHGRFSRLLQSVAA